MLNKYPLRIGVTVKRLRQFAGMNQQTLADRSGVSQGTISRIERGTIDPDKLSIGTLYRIAKALDMLPLSDMLKVLEAE